MFFDQSVRSAFRARGSAISPATAAGFDSLRADLSRRTRYWGTTNGSRATHAVVVAIIVVVIAFVVAGGRE
jgi:hypothetical protein